MQHITKGLKRTPEGAREAIRRYESNNADLPQPARRMLALAACGKYFGRRNLEAAVGESLPRFPFRDASWRYWNVLHFSGLGHIWDDFRPLAERHGIRKAIQYLRRTCTSLGMRLFLRRLGTDPHPGIRVKTVRVLWTKGGAWRTDSYFTTIIVQHQHAPLRPLVRRWQRKLGRDGIRLIERELMLLLDPDKLLVHEAKARAVMYMRRRATELLGWQRLLSVDAAAWFFQATIPAPRGQWVEPDHTGWRIVDRFPKRMKPWSW